MKLLAAQTVQTPPLLHKPERPRGLVQVALVFAAASHFPELHASWWHCSSGVVGVGQSVTLTHSGFGGAPAVGSGIGLRLPHAETNSAAMRAGTMRSRGAKDGGSTAPMYSKTGQLLWFARGGAVDECILRASTVANA